MVVYIYGLKDPRTGLIHYIGQSLQPRKRLWAHVRTTAWLMESWIKSLIEDGLRPELVILENCDAFTCNIAETRHVEEHRAAGHPLLNAPGRPTGARRAPSGRLAKDASAEDWLLRPAHLNVKEPEAWEGCVMDDLPALPPMWEWGVRQVSGKTLYGLRSPDGALRAVGQTPEQAILSALDGLWCAIAGVFT